MTAQIFISHDPAEAAAYVDGLSRFLAANGLPSWYERKSAAISGGPRWWSGSAPARPWSWS